MMTGLTSNSNIPLDYSSIRTQRDPHAVSAWISFSFMTVLALPYIFVFPFLHLKFREVFRDFNLKLPMLTNVVYGIPGIIYAAIAVLIITLGLIFTLTLPKKTARLFCRTTMIVLMLFLIVIALATIMPMIALINGVSGPPRGR